MKTIIKFLSAVAVLSMAVACDLNLTPKGTISYNTGDQIITNENDLDGFEANILSDLRGIEYGVYDQTSDIMVDYFNATSDYGNNYGSVHRTDDSFTTGDYETESNWEGPYSAIKDFNIFIEGAQVVPDGLQEAAAVVRGEAYFGRAYAYLHLARHFGKAYSSSASTDLCVPLVTVYDQTARPERATVEAVYEQIKRDLDSAAVLLKGVAGEVRAQKPTIDAVNALYARYYLDVQDYVSAAASALAVINTGNYAVSSTADEMEAEWINDNGTEPILQFYASTTEGSGAHSAYTNMSNDKEKGWYYQPYYIPCKKLVESYDESDLRLAQWFGRDEYPTFLTATWYNEKGNFQFYVFTKYFGNPDLYTSVANSYQAKKPLLISEMYLIAAEALLASGDTAGATTQLNVLQTRRGATATTATTENVRNEWYRETVGEGLRLNCLKRWGIGFSGREPQDKASELEVVMAGTYYGSKVMEASDYHFQWPVPMYEMQTNLKLVQNDGYDVTSSD